jgi:D-aminopeptidase
VAHHGSGEIFLAASTTARTDRDGAQLDTGPRLAGRQLDDLFAAVVDAAEESVLNSMLMSPTTVGRDGNTSEGLDAEVVRRLVEEHRAGH